MKYVGLYDEKEDIVTKEKLDAVASRVSTNEDNIAMAESDIDGLQTTVGTLQTNVNNVQTALTSKQDKVVGGASTITKDNLTANRALVSNSSGKVSVSTVTSTELGYLDGVTSNVQTQLNKKLEKAPVTSVNSKTGAVQLNASDVGALPDTTVIPSKTSQLDNDSGFITDIPIASTTQLGGVKIGAGLSVTENGVLSATGGGTADAVEWNNVLDKPTTIAGYGITDAKIENGTITLGNKTITPLTSAPVTSVNSKTGAVVLGASDVGALPADTVIPTVNNATLTIRRNSVDVGSFTANSANDVNIDINVPTDKSDVGLGNVDNVKQYSSTNPPPYPVTSVNGHTGNVNIESGTIVKQYTGTLLASGWATDQYGYQAQTISISGLKATYDVDPQWDVALSGTDPDADATLLEGFALIHNYTTGANSLTAQCIGAAPTINIPVKVVVFG